MLMMRAHSAVGGLQRGRGRRRGGCTRWDRRKYIHKKCAKRRVGDTVQKRGYEHEQEKSTAGGVAGVIVGNEANLR